MNKNTIYIKLKLLIVVLLFTTINSFCVTDSLKLDMSDISVRKPSSEQLNRLIEQKDFQYNEYYDSNESSLRSLPKLIYNYLMDWLSSIFKGVNPNFVKLIVKIFFYLLVVTAISVMLYFIFKSEIHSVVYSSKKINNSEFEINDVKTINFDELIENNISAKKYRYSIRYLHLYMLKKLDFKSHIEWNKNKTNSDYCKELKKNPFYGDFRFLTTVYEHVWYGEFKIDSIYFNKINSEFTKAFERIEDNEH